mmetsp:Transcript_17069/g.32292  ORF Transcript_17069/g.32292 Transcript_17069/m.32292 type:complete len:99 (-) Transcript_17069:366-662(-)
MRIVKDIGSIRAHLAKVTISEHLGGRPSGYCIQSHQTNSGKETKAGPKLYILQISQARSIVRTTKMTRCPLTWNDSDDSLSVAVIRLVQKSLTLESTF